MKIFNRKKKYEAVGWEEIIVIILGAIFYTGAAAIVFAPVAFVFELVIKIFAY